MSKTNSKGSLQQRKQKQEVLKAILNVKKYANNLKKNASTFSETNLSGEAYQITSSPSFFEDRKQFFNHEQTQSLIKEDLSVKETMRDTNSKKLRQNKQHSMTVLSSSKKNQQYSAFTKVKPKSKMIGKEHSEADSANQGTHSMKSSINRTRQVLSHSLKGDQLWSRIAIPHSDTESKKQSKKVNINPKLQFIQKQPHSLQGNKMLLQEISLLKNQIQLYKSAVLVLRKKYKQIQEKHANYISNSHLVDVLKLNLRDLQSRNEKLNEVISEQNDSLRQIGQKTMKSIETSLKNYEGDRQRLVKLEYQNKILKTILNYKYSKTIGTHVTSENYNIQKKNQQKLIDPPIFTEQSDIQPQYQQDSQSLALFQNRQELLKKYKCQEKIN